MTSAEIVTQRAVKLAEAQKAAEAEVQRLEHALNEARIQLLQMQARQAEAVAIRKRLAVQPNSTETDQPAPEDDAPA